VDSLHNNAYPHVALHTVETTDNMKPVVFHHPSYSYDIIPFDIHQLVKEAL
jgi:hypothetical protein